MRTIIEAFSFGLPFDGRVARWRQRCLQLHCQSQRAEIYQTFVQVARAAVMAYLYSAHRREAGRGAHEANKENFGYYGKYTVGAASADGGIEAETEQVRPMWCVSVPEGNIENKG